jgi:hypothetical protein
MDPRQIIAEMVAQNGGPCVLDRIHLPYATADSGPAAKFGFGCQLFLSDIDKASLRERSLQFLGDYWRTFPGRVNQFLPEGRRRAIKLKGDPTDRIRADSGKLPLNQPYGTVAGSASYQARSLRRLRQKRPVPRPGQPGQSSRNSAVVAAVRLTMAGLVNDV